MYNCPNTSAEADLWSKLGGAATLAQAQAYVKTKICPQAYSDKGFVSFTQAAKKGTDYQFEKLYFDGKTNWNEQVETIYYDSNSNEQSGYNLQRDTSVVSTFFNTLAKTEQVEFPSTLSNFQSCASNVAYCCFVTDRQANDNNGNCATPYDLNCVDKDPGDNTDLCYVDHKRGNMSNKANSNGETVFSKDDDNNSDNAEGPIHCHGFAWSNDPNDYTSRYKGNTLHFVSQFDHLNQRGYVRNVPGAPMCACAEQMPVISRADCTETIAKETFKFFYTGQIWVANLTSIDLTFTACNGYNGNNNNLYAYMQRLYFLEKKVNSSQLAALDKSVVGNNNCEYATAAYLQSKGYKPGFQESNSATGMLQMAGRGFFLMDGNTAAASSGNMGDSSFMNLYRSSPTGIILRICQECEASHQKIYVRFNPGYEPNEPSSTAPFFQWLKLNFPQNETMVGKYGISWAMYSTYQDALTRQNSWRCPNYNWLQGFPGDCDPVLGTKMYQYSRFEPYYEGQMHTAWLIDSANPFVPRGQRTFGGNKNFTSTELNYIDTPRRGGFDTLSNGTMYIRGSGWDIWSDYDYAHFTSNFISGLNATFSVRIRSFIGYPTGNTWARTCLMIRKSQKSNSASYELCLTSGNDFVSQWRSADNGYKDGYFIMWDGTSKVNSGWMKVKKNGDYYSSYVSYDGINWQQRGTTQYLPGLVDSTYFVGIAINSQSDRLAEAVLDNFVAEGTILFLPSDTDPITTAKPSTANPIAAKPIAATPITAKPITFKPITAKPITAKPITSKPTAKPITTKPNPTNPAPTSAVPVFALVKPAPAVPISIPANPAPAVPKPVVVPAVPKPAVVPAVPKPAVVPTVPKPAVVPAAPKPVVVPAAPKPAVVPAAPKPAVVPAAPKPA
jgi:hypothetical protein